MATMAKRAESSATTGVTPTSPLCSSTARLDLPIANPAAVGQLLLKQPDVSSVSLKKPGSSG